MDTKFSVLCMIVMLFGCLMIIVDIFVRKTTKLKLRRNLGNYGRAVIYVGLILYLFERPLWSAIEKIKPALPFIGTILLLMIIVFFALRNSVRKPDNQ